MGWRRAGGRLTVLCAALGLVVAVGACSDDVVDGDGSGGQCGPGETFNPISGVCVPARGGDDDLDAGSNNRPDHPDGDSTPSTPDGSPTPDSGPSNNNGNNSNNPIEPDADDGTCGPGQSCDAGELDAGDVNPWDPDDNIEFHSCSAEDVQGLTPPQFVVNGDANYKLALETSVNTGSITGTMGSTIAHVFEDPQHGYTGFVVSLSAPGAQTEPGLLSDHVLSTVQGQYAAATRRGTGRRISTHDTLHAQVGAVIDLPDGTAPEAARDKILAGLTGLAEQDLQHNLTATFTPDPAGPTQFIYEVVSRSPQQFIVVGAFATMADYQDPTLTTGIRVDDITGGTSLAYADETLTAECVSYTVRDTSEVDIIISLDASGSMSGVRDALSNFASDFTQLLNAANVDWRIGVTSVDCSNVQSDTGLSQDYRDLWPPGGGSPWQIPPPPCSAPFQSGNNGKLLGGGFTTDFQQIESRLDSVSTTGAEYTLTMGVAALDRALPRADGVVDKIRPQAAVILVVVTDENEQLFKDELSFLGGNSTLNGTQQAELEQYTRPWVDFLLKPEIGATVFGLYWIPGESCEGATDVAHGVHHVVTRTGGQGGSVCQPDVTNTMRDIASATSGIASGLRLVGVPAASSIHVKSEDGNTQAIRVLDRSRADGFDYDSTVNRIVFLGPNPPLTGDRVIIPYLRWDRSVIPCQTTADCPQEQKFKCIAGICR